jgi:Domain of unknown function (DUF1841)
MDSYNPDTTPSPQEWLQTDEGERITLVAAHHRHKRIALPNAQLHAVVHVVVENQLAMGEERVVATSARLQAEGLSRHDAIHAIGSVLAENLYELMQDDTSTTDEPYRRYLERLETLSARNWREG